jgi:hypothetical protein
MSIFQTLAAAIILFVIALAGTYIVFRDPVPYAYDNLTTSLEKSVRKKGVLWAKFKIDGDQIKVTGIAPDHASVVYVRTLIQQKTGVTASFNEVQLTDNTTPQNKANLNRQATDNHNSITPASTQSSSLSSEQDATANTAPDNDTNAQASTVASPPPSPLEGKKQAFYTLTVSKKESTCLLENEKMLPSFSLQFRQNTPALVAESLGKLDVLASNNKQCPSKVNIVSKEPGNDTLHLHRIDEIRYYLMASGFSADQLNVD